MPKRIKMNERSPHERIKDFDQVNTGYSNLEAITEAKRCLQCKKPLCVEGCPVEINIPGFIKAIAENNPSEAIIELKKKNNLPAVCGRVCPQENQCEMNCILGKKAEPIAIGNLERYASDWEKEFSHKNLENTTSNQKINEKIAVIGSGPAGLTCAGDLAKLNFDVTVFESLHKPGGVLRYGIPAFRLPANVLDYELDNLKNLGVKFKMNYLIGRTKTIQNLFDEGYKAIFIGTGAGLPKFLNIQGENLNYIYSANEFLVRVNLMHANKFPDYDTPLCSGKKVAVIGGGNTAMDSARTALRLGAEEVTLIYRRSEHEMPARKEEFYHAKEEGIQFMFLTNPIKFLGNDKGAVTSAECIKMELSEPDESGRLMTKPIEKSNFIISVDMVILAVGLNPNPVLPSLTEGIQTDNYGHIKIDENYMTSLKGVFAGGDITGGDTVIQAMGMGKKAARAIAEFISNSTSLK